jgi:flagellar biosynthesis/type III secretory pathway M-ring protein FliF/YscJ
VNVETEARNAAREEEDARLRSTLAELVRQDPDRAAQVLQRWLDRAG